MALCGFRRARELCGRSATWLSGRLKHGVPLLAGRALRAGLEPHTRVCELERGAPTAVAARGSERPPRAAPGGLWGRRAPCRPCVRPLPCAEFAGDRGLLRGTLRHPSSDVQTARAGFAVETHAHLSGHLRVHRARRIPRSRPWSQVGELPASPGFQSREMLLKRGCAFPSAAAGAARATHGVVRARWLWRQVGVQPGEAGVECRGGQRGREQGDGRRGPSAAPTSPGAPRGLSWPE